MAKTATLTLYSSVLPEYGELNMCTVGPTADLAMLIRVAARWEEDEAHRAVFRVQSERVKEVEVT